MNLIKNIFGVLVCVALYTSTAWATILCEKCPSNLHCETTTRPYYSYDWFASGNGTWGTPNGIDYRRYDCGWFPGPVFMGVEIEVVEDTAWITELTIQSCDGYLT